MFKYLNIILQEAHQTTVTRQLLLELSSQLLSSQLSFHKSSLSSPSQLFSSWLVVVAGSQQLQIFLIVLLSSKLQQDYSKPRLKDTPTLE